jgi:hypothetical protein
MSFSVTVSGHVPTGTSLSVTLTTAQQSPQVQGRGAPAAAATTTAARHTKATAPTKDAATADPLETLKKASVQGLPGISDYCKARTSAPLFPQNPALVAVSDDSAFEAVHVHNGVAILKLVDRALVPRGFMPRGLLYTPAGRMPLQQGVWYRIAGGCIAAQHLPEQFPPWQLVLLDTPETRFTAVPAPAPPAAAAGARRVRKDAEGSGSDEEDAEEEDA